MSGRGREINGRRERERERVSFPVGESARGERREKNDDGSHEIV